MENQDLLDLKQYALQSAILFNTIAHNGKKVEYYSNEELIEAINLQVNITMEENLEFFENVEIDLVEELDGIVDSVYYTAPYLEYLIKEFNTRDIKEANSLLLKRLQLTRTLSSYIEENISFSDKVVIEATNRIVENNMSKFTKDSNVFADWKDGGMIRKSVEVDGEYYYLLVNKNGKVKKHLDFKGVSLEDLVNNEQE